MKTMQVIINQKGFTLIELMVVAVILAIISAIAVPLYTGYKEEARTHEAYFMLEQLANVCINKAGKALEMGGSVDPKAVTMPGNGEYFSYNDDIPCTTTGGVFTATSLTDDSRKLTVTVAFSGTPPIPSKTLSGTLY